MTDFVLLSTADWDHPLWTNKQHVALSLVKLGHRVLYIDSLGLRSPRLQARGQRKVRARSDLDRAIRRLIRALLPPRRVRPGLWVWSPPVLPGASSGVPLWINRQILGCALPLWSGWLDLRDVCLWTYNPITLAVVDSRRWKRIIYHCVDAIQEQPHMPARAIKHWEKRLCSRADLVFVTSPDLQRQLCEHNPKTIFYPNVADAKHFSQALDQGLALPDDMAAIREPRVGFVGAINAYKLDFPLIRSLAQENPQWSFVFVGPVGEGDPECDANDLENLPNVHLIGPRTYNELPAYLKGMAIGLLPLQHNPYTRAMFPMKFFEYLAAGLPVVATEIDALKPYASLALLCEPTSDAFSKAIRNVLRGEGPPLAQRLEGASRHTYQHRTEAMLRDLEALG